MVSLTEKDKEIERLQAQVARQTRLIDQLKEAVILGLHHRFAKANEALRSLQSELFDEAEHEALGLEQAPKPDTVMVPSHTRKTSGGRKPLPADLPRIDQVYDLDDNEKVCDHGHALTPMSEKVSEQLDVIPMQLQVIRHVRKQYVCKCCEQAGETQIKTANKPKQPIEKSQASPGLLAYIATAKYTDSLPLYRQCEIFKRCDIELNRTTLASWMVRCGELVQPIINRLEEHLLSAKVLHMDETPVQVLNEAGKRAQSKSYMWVRKGAPPDRQGQNIILFDYDPSRSSSVPLRLLDSYAGALVVDGYAGYDAVCTGTSIMRIGCWAHARRKFVEATKANKKNNGQASKVLKLIAKLYKLEKAINDSDPQTKHQQRKAKAKPIIDQLHTWLTETQPKVPPQATLGKAITYLANQWPSLVRYLEDGAYPIDNNTVENAIRPFAIGRKNWLFSQSVQGANASANLYSLIETAKANGLEPYGYLKRVFTTLPNATNYDAVDELLPLESHSKTPPAPNGHSKGGDR